MDCALSIIWTLFQDTVLHYITADTLHHVVCLQEQSFLSKLQLWLMC